MYVQLRCPLQAERITSFPYSNDRTRTRFFVRFYPERVPEEISCAVIWRSADRQSVLMRAEHIERPAPGTVPGLYEISVIADGKAPESTPGVLFTRIQFPDGTIWSDPDEEETEMPDAEPLSAEHLEWLQRIKGEGADVVCASLGTDAGWLCICGHWNLARRRECARCSRSRDEVLSLYGSDRVEVEYEREKNYQTDFLIKNVGLRKKGRRRLKNRAAKKHIRKPFDGYGAEDRRKKRKTAETLLIAFALLAAALILRLIRFRLPG